MIETTQDKLLGGRLRFAQPADGYRAAIDPVLLAAAAGKPVKALDLGCGAGAALLCLLARAPETQAVGVEIDLDLAGLARDNLAANDFASRARIVEGDAAAFGETGFDLVMVNPPYLDPARADPRRTRANARPIWKAISTSPLGSKPPNARRRPKPISCSCSAPTALPIC